MNVTREAAWRYLVLLYDAEAEGVEVTDGEITELLDSLPQFSDQNGFNRDAYVAMLASSGWTDADMDRWFTQMCRVAKLINLQREAVLVSNAELWMAYVYSAESVRINYVGLDASLFRPLVQVTDEEMQKFYDEHRDELPADSKDGIGYKAPKRVRAEYALVSVDQLAKQVKVTDKEVSDYYDAHKEDYRLPEESKPKPGDGRGEGGRGEVQAPEGRQRRHPPEAHRHQGEGARRRRRRTPSSPTCRTCGTTTRTCPSPWSRWPAATAPSSRP